MYRGRTDKVYKSKNPYSYKIWFCVQVSFVISLLAMAIYSFVA